MIYFGITKQEKKNRTQKRKQLNTAFFVLIFLCFIFFSFSSKISQIVFSKNKIDIFQENLNHIAFSFRAIDKNLSQFLMKIDDIQQAYSKGENILQTKEKQIDECLTYIQKNKEYLKKVGFSDYENLINFLGDLQKHEKEVFQLLGKEKSQNYLVILENTNEKRPNGGFFGSFAFITIQGAHITTMEIVDSYYPDFIAYRTRIMAPDRTAPFLPDRKIGFIAGNKFGFTDMDGKNLKDLYELMFGKTYEMWKVQQTMQPDLYNKLLNQDIKGVIFVRSDLLEKILPGFKQKIRERQFLNAAVDLIRKEERGNKKELYIKEIKQYFNDHKMSILKNVVNRFGEIANNQYLTMYFSNVSQEFYGLLSKNKLFNIFSPQNIYFRDMNASYNKIDGFVSKRIQITDAKNDMVMETDQDIVPIEKLGSGTYNIRITYTLSIPAQYRTFIQSLEEKYKVKLEDRERAILGMKAGTYDEPGQGLVKKRRETKSSIYFPRNIQMLKVTGDIYYQTQFYPPFANGLFYQMGTIENNTSRSIDIEIEVK
ncbi:MAG: hypothetical protein WC875_03560 [Candidatus Absconditabacterales bacterium]